MGSYWGEGYNVRDWNEEVAMDWSQSVGGDESVGNKSLGWNPQGSRMDRKTEAKLEEDRFERTRKMRRNIQRG